MLVDALPYLESDPRQVLLPGFALTAAVIGFNILGNRSPSTTVQNRSPGACSRSVAPDVAGARRIPMRDEPLLSVDNLTVNLLTAKSAVRPRRRRRLFGPAGRMSCYRRRKRQRQDSDELLRSA